jgi:NAD(P)-dependent dehydrogenase (short-subunit alcohol dehydrogenase family)
MRLAGKVALVTGAAQGIGAAICQSFAAEGAQVIATDEKDDAGAAMAQAVARSGGSCVFQHLDVRSERDWDAAFTLAKDRYGQLDVLVNNAAVDIANDIEHMTIDEWRLTLSVNLEGVMLGIKRAIALMKERRQGSIINIASVAALVSSPSTAAYSSSKSAVLGLTRSVALHCAAARYGIRVNMIHPGPIRTPMVMKYATGSPQLLAQMQAAIPMGSLGEPADIAAGAVYLASDDAKWVTGSSLVIDGGYTAQ